MCVLNFHDLFNLLVCMYIYCLNQSELSLKLEVEAGNCGVTKGTPTVYTGHRQIQMAPSPFLSFANILFLTLPYLLIENSDF